MLPDTAEQLYELAISRTRHYTAREQVLVLLNFDQLWLRWFGVQPTDQQREAFTKALRAHLQREAG